MINSKLNIVYNKSLLGIKLKNQNIKTDELIAGLRKQLKIPNNKKIILVKNEQQIYNESDTEIIPPSKEKFFLIEKDKYEDVKYEKKNMCDLIMTVTGGTTPLKAPEIKSNMRNGFPNILDHIRPYSIENNQEDFSDEDEEEIYENDYYSESEYLHNHSSEEILQEIINRNFNVYNHLEFERQVNPYLNNNRQEINQIIPIRRPVEAIVDQSLLFIFLEMGFQENNIRIALRLANNNFEYAYNLLANAPPEVFQESNNLSDYVQNIPAQNQHALSNSNSNSNPNQTNLNSNPFRVAQSFYQNNVESNRVRNPFRIDNLNGINGNSREQNGMRNPFLFGPFQNENVQSQSNIANMPNVSNVVPNINHNQHIIEPDPFRSNQYEIGRNRNVVNANEHINEAHQSQANSDGSMFELEENFFIPRDLLRAIIEHQHAQGLLDGYSNVNESQNLSDDDYN